MIRARRKTRRPQRFGGADIRVCPATAAALLRKSGHTQGGRRPAAALPAQEGGRTISGIVDAETLAAELNREPFVPLRLHLSDGRTVDVSHPGVSFIVRHSLHVFAARPHRALAEDVQVISLRHILSMDHHRRLPHESV